MSFKKNNRRVHKWLSIIIVLPLLMVFVSGALLLLKKSFHFIQPATLQGESHVPSIAFGEVLVIAASVEPAAIKSWQDIERLDVRPAKGIIKIRSHNRVEIQIDSQSGAVLQVAKRRSDLIESIHDATFFQQSANLWLMLPVALAAIVMSLTGVIMFMIPYSKKRRRF